MAYGRPDVESVVVGRDVKLTCVVVAGNPAPRVTWSRRGELVQSTGRLVDDGAGGLYVKNVVVDDAGEYVCTASNIGGTTSNSVRLDVLGNESNSITLASSELAPNMFGASSELVRS